MADDEETFLLSTADLLRREGYECVCVRDGSSAFRRLETSDYDLLIADIKMPGNPDLELIGDVSRIAEGMPVIVVTGYPSLHTAIKSIQLPVDAYLVKPINFNQLKEQVQVSIERFRIYRTIRSTRQRLGDLRDDLMAMEESVKRWNSDEKGIDIAHFRQLTVHNIIEALWDLNHLLEEKAEHRNEREICHLFNCPRLKELIDAVMETITVLEKTKSAFKSKDLGRLRRKLMEVIDGK